MQTAVPTSAVSRHSDHKDRAAFLAAGIPGLLLAVATSLLLSEPRQFHRPAAVRTHESLASALTALLAKRTYRYSLLALTLYFFVFYGVLIFVPSHLVRAMQIPLDRASAMYGTVAGAASLIGPLTIGWIADRLSSKDVRWWAWIPAGACAAAAPLLLLAFATRQFTLFLACSFAALIVITGGLPSSLAAIQAVCGSHRRATAVALMLFCGNVVGAGLGPVLTGAMSEAGVAKMICLLAAQTIKS